MRWIVATQRTSAEHRVEVALVGQQRLADVGQLQVEAFGLELGGEGA